MAVITPLAARRTGYLADLRMSHEWDPFMCTLWEAARHAKETVESLEALRGQRGMMRSLMLERLIEHAEAEWREIEAYAYPLVEALR